MPSALARWVLASVFFAGEAAPAPFVAPVRQAPTLEAFVPEGWTVELAVEGELNGDAELDRVLVLLQSEQAQGDRQRALLVLLRQGEAWELAGTSTSLLPCFQCLGVRGGDGTPEMGIRSRVIAVSVWGGSRYWYGSTHRFRWNAATRTVQLIGLDGSQGDSVTGASVETSANLLTGDVFTVTTPAQEDLEGNPTHAVPRTKKEKRPKLPLIALERVQWPR